MEQLPFYIYAIFGVAVFATIALFYKAAHHSKAVLFILIAWMALQAAVGLTGFYTNTTGLPPRFMLLITPPLVTIAGLFLTRAGKRFVDGLNMRVLTLLHVIRIPIELILFWLFLHKAVPQLMTFEGRNFDVLSGLTALLVFYFGFVKKRLGRNALLLWNFGCLGLLINIVAIATLAAPFEFQKLAFDQPNMAVLYFPFVLLPAVVVPLVLLSHLASIRQLLIKRTASANEQPKARGAELSPVSLH